ncbi:proteasome inhibitor PI31 subunit-like [Varroa jacobsoni]|uniref:Proteasome inhibitor PI31 subunit n=1 Tax=Varroa destructor TaxID=109461 RepID=A0A7M7JJT2_VARDE|nr:proteasome inhibitor PI31 subunit-like [Varroa destructor]XP_022688266.1 proteasome inhibitor PI31 subunit-like [Varroa jacobsoni]
MAAPDFGLEALYKLQPIESTKNALCLLVHFVLTKHGWRYVGRGTEWKENETGSESLPAGWQASDEQYRYVSRTEPRKKVIIKYVEHDVFLLVNMVNVEDQVAMAMNINTSTEVDSTQLASNNPRLVFPKLLSLLSEVFDKLVKPCQVISRTVGTSTAPATSVDNLFKPDPSRNQGPSFDPPRQPAPNPLSRGEIPLGRRDLDPFLGQGPGGGMIIDPLRNLRSDRFPGPEPLGPDGIPLPRGAVPPGARFEPFFPEGAVSPDLGNRPSLDPFHPSTRFRPPYGPPDGGSGSGADFM